MARPEDTIQDLIQKLEMTTGTFLDTHNFICVDQLMTINGDETEDENVWVWRRTDGMEVTMYDEGNDKHSLVKVTKMPLPKKKKYKNAKPELVGT